MRRLGLTGVICALGTLWSTGCSCNTTTLGQECTDDTDCDLGQICSPDTGRCEFPEEDDAGPDPGVDGGPEVDGGADVDGGPTCTDADMDGVTDCAGDCDDSDPTTYPGATEVCGDGIDNACGMDPDGSCGGLGTFVAEAPVGSDTNPGTQAMPVATIAQGITNAMTIGGGVDVFVAAGNYPEDVVFTEGISLYGGYEATGWTRDPAANVTTIENQTAAGVTFPMGITRATELDGFTVQGRRGTSSNAAITVMNGAEPTIRGNVIRAGNASGNSNAIRVNFMGAANTASPLIVQNEIRLAGSGGGWGGGNGAWGIYAERTPVEIDGNRILLAEADVVQRGIELRQSDDAALVTGNVVRHPAGRAEVVFGIRLASGGATIDSNDVHAGRCETFCIALALEGNLTTAVVTNNVLVGGEGATQHSAGLNLAFERVPMTTPDVLIHSNTLDGGAGSPMGPTYGLFMGENPASPIVVGRVFNNVLRSGRGARRFAFHEHHANIDPEAFENNALFVDQSTSVTPPTQAVLYWDEGATALTDAAMINGLSVAQSNLVDDCSIVNPVVDGDWHLGAMSMCRDAGTATEAPSVDFEGDARPAGSAHDIGADEG